MASWRYRPLSLLLCSILTPCSALLAQTQPTSAQAQVQRLTQQGFERYRHNDLTGAEAIFRQTTTLAPADGLTWFNLGLVLADQGKLPEAAAAYEKSIPLLTKQNIPKLSLSNACNNLALVYYRQKRFEDATARANQGMQAWPQNAEPHISLGVILEAQGKRPEDHAADL